MVLSCTVSENGDLLAKNSLFFPTPLSFGALAPYVPFGILRRKLTARKLESWGYPPVKTHGRSLSLFGFDTVPACDGQTGGQTGGGIYYS